MGITGLLPLLKKASANCNVRKFSGCTVAIDAYCWLHKGAFGCAAQLGKGEPTTAYVTYCVKYLNVLLAHNIKPILVLDGRNLPSKSETEKKRRAKREENRKNAKEFLRKGMNKEAWECFTRCVDITPAMARTFIKVLREMKLDYIIAPYEADAQLAYLAIHNIVDIVITEDSDLILFGCPKIFFKMSVTGDGVLFDQAKIAPCLGLKPKDFSFERFRWMCILSGCDYLASIPGIGLGRAKKLIEGTEEITDIRKILQAIPRILRLDIEVPKEYVEGFLQAELTFLHQLVFDPINKSLIPLTPYPKNVDPESLYFAGAYVDSKLALDMALGNVDIHTLKKVDQFDPNLPHTGYGQTSIWSPRFVVPSVRRSVTARDVKPKNKSTTSIGMEGNVSVVVKSKRHSESKTKDFEIEEDQEQLISMYSSRSKNESTAAESKTIDISIIEKRSTKRKRGSSCEMSTDENQIREDSSPAKRLSTRKNPFLKTTPTPKKVVEISNSPDKTKTLQPVCLIQKNKVYDIDKIIVKSQYFRNQEDSAWKSTRTLRSSNRVQVLTEDATDEISIDEITATENITLSEKMDSQLTIYSIDEDCNDNNSNKESVCDSEESQVSSSSTTSAPTSQTTSLENDSPLIKVNDDDDFDEVSIHFSGPQNSFGNSQSNSSGSPQISSFNKAAPKKQIIDNRRVGLSKSSWNSKKKTVDPKQKKISSMFSILPKMKL